LLTTAAAGFAAGAAVGLAAAAGVAAAGAVVGAVAGAVVGFAAGAAVGLAAGAVVEAEGLLQADNSAAASVVPPKRWISERRVSLAILILVSTSLNARFRCVGADHLIGNE